MSPAAADVPTVDTLPAHQPASGPVPAEPEHGPAWGEGWCRGVGRRAASGESAGAEMGQQRLSDLAAASIGISEAGPVPRRDALVALTRPSTADRDPFLLPRWQVVQESRYCAI
jgi:hypothetical protein